MTDISEMFQTQAAEPIPADAVKFSEEQVAEATETKTEETAETAQVKDEKAEATEVKTETKEEKTSFFADFEKGSKSEEVKTETTVALKPEELKELEDGRQALAELNRIKSSPAAKILAGDYDLTKITDLKAFAKQLVGEDFSSMSPEQLIAKKIDSEYPDLSAEDKEELVKEDIDAYEKLSPSRQKAESLKIASSLAQKQPESDLLKTLTEVQKAQKEVGNPDEYYKNRFQTEIQEALTTTLETAKAMSATMLDQEYKGYKVTADDVAAVDKAFEEHMTTFDPANPNKSLFNTFLAITADKRVEEAEKRGYERGIKEQANPNRNDVGSAVIVTKDSSNPFAQSKKEDFFKQANN